MRYLTLLVLLAAASSHGMVARGRVGAVAGHMSGSGLQSFVFVGRGMAAPPAEAEGYLLPAAARATDTDAGGLPDYADPDNDNDGLTDEAELSVYHTDPHHLDSDGDGLSDGDEVRLYQTNPNSRDTDHDGATDDWEIAHGLDPKDDVDADEDRDGDGLSNRQEFDRGSDPDAYEIELTMGWNMVSLARIPDDNSPEHLFQGNLRGPVWVWNAASMQYDEAVEILPLKGHWLYSDKSLRIRITLPNTVDVEELPAEE